MDRMKHDPQRNLKCNRFKMLMAMVVVLTMAGPASQLCAQSLDTVHVEPDDFPRELAL
jgi:hypothetical protein